MLTSAENIGPEVPSSVVPLRWLTSEAFSLIAHRILVVYCLVAALSIALSQIIVIALFVYWLAHRYAVARIGERDDVSTERTSAIWLSLAAPMLCLTALLLFASIVGVNPARAFPELLKTSLYMLLPFVVFSALTTVSLRQNELLSRITVYFTALIGGQAIAALYTVFIESLSLNLAFRPPGPVTESGQLVLVLGPALILTYWSLAVSKQDDAKERLLNFSDYLVLAVTLLTALFIAWPNLGQGIGRYTTTLQIVSGVALLGVCFPLALRNILAWLKRPHPFRRLDSREFRVFSLVCCALLLACLMINLKRGAWLGVVTELVICGALFSRKLLAGTLAIAAFCVAFVAPISSRVANWLEDFSIGGGRESMWALGLEIVARYPLGVGPDNAKFMRQIDPTLPETHRHMHNNFLNIAVEAGWIGLAAYLWWMLVAIGLGFALWNRFCKATDEIQRRYAEVGLILACALIGWQTAGLVEYNFGDGEVKLIALFFMGLLLALTANKPEGSSTTE